MKRIFDPNRIEFKRITFPSLQENKKKLWKDIIFLFTNDIDVIIIKRLFCYWNFVFLEKWKLKIHFLLMYSSFN